MSYYQQVVNRIHSFSFCILNLKGTVAKGMCFWKILKFLILNHFTRLFSKKLVGIKMPPLHIIHNMLYNLYITMSNIFFHAVITLCVCVCVCVLTTQLCPTLCDPTGCSPSGFSGHVILHARILEWVTIPFSGGSS